VSIHRAITQVVDRYDLQILTIALGIQCAQDITADTAKTIDCDSKSHLQRRRRFVVGITRLFAKK
jgi:hypothetical protein